jgi:hypothetical protein
MYTAKNPGLPAVPKNVKESQLIILSLNLNITILHIYINLMQGKSTSARSNAWVYHRSLARIAGSNPSSSMDICLL